VSTQQKSPFKMKRPPSTEMALQITSMADIFTIILVFLLKSFATGSLNISPSSALHLPVGNGNGEAVEAMKVEISETAVEIESAPVAKLTKFRFAPSDLQPNGVPTPLDEAFNRQKQRQALIAKANSDVQLDKKILVMADQHTPYLTLKSVVSAAAVHGFTDLKLVVVKKD